MNYYFLVQHVEDHNLYRRYRGYQDAFENVVVPFLREQGLSTVSQSFPLTNEQATMLTLLLPDNVKLQLDPVMQPNVPRFNP